MMNNMKALEIARRLAQLGETEKAVQAYTLAVAEARGKDPDAELEGALYLFQNGGNYKIAYDSFKALYNGGFMREDLLAVMTGAFYEPNVKLQKTRYEKNCKLLAKYPYLFRKDFLPFEELPIRFYPYDDERYTPFDTREGRFGENINFNHPVVSRNFFRDPEKPVLAADVYSMYELEYLNDNVRKSEWVGRENHIYLHYSDWGTFCAHLQVLNLRELLREEKIVFLIGEEVCQYPIDFKERFGLDYSTYPVKPVGIREIHRLIWHTQLSAHNGGDFFNEILDRHPNLIALDSLMMDSLEEKMEELRKSVRDGTQVMLGRRNGDPEVHRKLVQQFMKIKSPTEKDCFVLLFLLVSDLQYLDPAARVAPAILFQPHFKNMVYKIVATPRGQAELHSEEYERIQNFSVFKAFKYIKTFTPMRRITTSTAASVRFFQRRLEESWEEGDPRPAGNVLLDRVLNRSFMVDWEDRLFKDSVLVRFEDGKLNPRATFTALAAFLDIPYTESMTYCSMRGEVDPLQFATNVRGFDSASVYRTYDEYLGPRERFFLEYFMRDAYARYGYDFHYYDGRPVDMARLEELLAEPDVSLRLMMTAHEKYMAGKGKDKEITDRDGVPLPGKVQDEIRRRAVELYRENTRKNDLSSAEILLRNLRFVNKNGRPLNFMPLLKLDPGLLEQPLYH